MRLPLLVTAMAALAQPALAQETELTRPADWIVRFDRPAPDSSIYFVDMPPGWHITTGPAAILYDPTTTATGSYRVEAEIFLFPGERLEGYGMFVGGRDLDGDNQAYTYFLLRKDGKFLIKERHGAETSTLVPWTTHEAVVPHDGGEDPIKNVLAVNAAADQLTFSVNGQEVARLDRAGLPSEGITGLRVNHRLNLHVTRLAVEAR